MATVAQVQFQESISEQWAVCPSSESLEVLSWHGSQGAAAKVASSVPAYVVRKMTTEEVEDPEDPPNMITQVAAAVTVAQTSAAFWSYGE